MARISAWIGLLAGFLLLAASFAHGLMGWPPFGQILQQEGIDPGVMGGLQVGWYWGSFCMFAAGCIVVVEAITAIRGGAPHRPAILIIGALYVVFGTWAYVFSGYNTHFLGFIGSGALVLLLLLAIPLAPPSE
jgi:hypothetical protein